MFLRLTFLGDAGGLKFSPFRLIDCILIVPFMVVKLKVIPGNVSPFEPRIVDPIVRKYAVWFPRGFRGVSVIVLSELE